jgi:hypothetical protein
LPDLPGVPPEMMALLRAGMASDERARPDAGALRDALLALRLEPGPPEPPAPATPRHAFPQLPPDEQPTEPQRRSWWRRPRGRWFAAGATVVAVGLLLWYTLSPHAGPLPPPPQAGRSTAPPSSSSPPPRSPAVSGVPCLLTAGRPGLLCVTTPECYGADMRALACTEQHVFEVFAMALLPPEVKTADAPAIRRNASVRNACAPGNAALLDVAALNWRTDVLPPTPDAFRAGNRWFKCLAGPPHGAVTGSRFVRQ